MRVQQPPPTRAWGRRAGEEGICAHAEELRPNLGVRAQTWAHATGRPKTHRHQARLTANVGRRTTPKWKTPTGPLGLYKNVAHGFPRVPALRMISSRETR